MQEEKAPQQDATAEAASDTIPTSQAGSGQAPGEAAPPAADDLAKQLEEARAAVLYARAEAENIRRRAAEDVQKASRFAVEKFAGSLLSVRDSLEAALATDASNTQALREGVELTLKQLESAFDGAQVRAENPVDLSGDEAVRMQKLLDALEDLDDVQDVFHNASLDA